MFEISQLKEKKLPELQDIAQKLKISKYRSLKKLDLVYQILDHQAANPSVSGESKEDSRPQRPKRERLQRPRENSKQKSVDLKEKIPAAVSVVEDNREGSSEKAPQLNEQGKSQSGNQNPQKKDVKRNQSKDKEGRQQ